MSRDSRSMRGAAIAETAVIVSFVLLLLFGTLELIEVGYLQTAADGAVFMTAHEYAIATASPNVVAYASPYPGVQVPNVQFTAMPPEDTQEPLDYGLGATTARYGGIQMIRPQHLQAKYAATFQGFLSGGALSSLPISGGAVEARYMMADRGYSVDGWTPNNSSTYSHLINPLTQDDQNTPPYMVGWHQMIYCDAADLTATYPAKCTTLFTTGLGLAEYLDHDNYSTAAGANGVYPDTATFYQMACHQKIYVAIAAALPLHFDGVNQHNGRNNDAAAQADANYYQNAPTNAAPNGARSDGIWSEAYDWDYYFTNWIGGATTPGTHPMHPGAHC